MLAPKQGGGGGRGRASRDAHVEGDHARELRNPTRRQEEETRGVDGSVGCLCARMCAYVCV